MMLETAVDDQVTAPGVAAESVGKEKGYGVANVPRLAKLIWEYGLQQHLLDLFRGITGEARLEVRLWRTVIKRR